MLRGAKFKILILLAVNIIAIACIYIHCMIVNYDVDTEVVIFPNSPGWYFIIYDDTGDSHLDSHLDINFAIDNENVFWAYGRSLDHGWKESITYIDDGKGSVDFISKTKMRTYTAGNTSRRIGGKPYTISYVYLGYKPNSGDYVSSLSQINLEEKIRSQTNKRSDPVGSKNSDEVD